MAIQCTKFEVFSFSRFGDILGGGGKNLNGSRDHKMPRSGRFDVGVLGLVMIKQLPNLKSLRSPTTKIRKATKTQKLRWFWGQGSLKDIGNIAIR